MVGPSLYCLSRAVNNLVLKNGSQPNCLTVVVAGIAVTVATVAVVTAETIVAMAVAVTIAVAVTVGSIEKVGVGLSLPLAVVVAVAVVAVGGDGDGVLVDDGLSKAVGDDGAGANGQRSLAGVVDLGVESGGTKDGGHLVDGSLQLTVVTGNGLVASDGNGDGGVGGNNVGLDGGGVGLVGDGLGGGDNGRGSIGVGSVGVSSSEKDLRVGLSLPLAVDDASVTAVVATVAA